MRFRDPFWDWASGHILGICIGYMVVWTVIMIPSSFLIPNGVIWNVIVFGLVGSEILIVGLAIWSRRWRVFQRFTTPLWDYYWWAKDDLSWKQMLRFRKDRQKDRVREKQAFDALWKE